MPLYFRMLPFLQAYTVIVCCIGLFGNINLIVATCRYKSLRTKLGCLLMISTISHTICLISELISVKLKLRFTETHRDECFRFVVVYMFAVLFQSTLFLMMAIDLLLAVVMPIRHKLWQRGPYLLILCTPPILFSSFAIFIEQLYINHDNLLMCTVSLAAPRKVRFWGTIITFSTVLLAVGGGACDRVLKYMLMKSLRTKSCLKTKLPCSEQASSSPFIRHSSSMNKKPGSSEVKLLKSLATLIFFFICSWTKSVVLFHVAMYFDSSIGYQFHKYTVSLWKMGTS
ncbi:hypothetical protein CAEBREN_28387 [Caenorhabditis brenneri]|uniref:G-protein coupled receptors family 1 profile domain-containing protein n=1 Tax=Caenorhabditis brenneri TaxID=135651 RepID=G0MXM0_CAEBE|nr:hypothetical protein CAEBREN_28387 [Caenorhabditis brenneri]